MYFREAWGRNFYGQLGDGTTEDRHIPIQTQSGN
ncbi:MAG: RCC1 domain-containing protein [Candidatus Pacebacteria bacterium]|nr:RCC1 domain-containing protein [Candidatus Paceibacterota bacterium]